MEGSVLSGMGGSVTPEYATSDTALMKLLFLVQRDVKSKWKKPMHN